MLPPTPVLLELAAGVVVHLSLIAAQGFGVQTTACADAAIALENRSAKIARVGAKLPFVNALGAAEGVPPPRDLAATSPAGAPFALHPSSGLDAPRAHTRSSYPRPRMLSMIRARI